MKIVEGSWYLFKVEKQIEFDDRLFWVFIGPDSKKYLLDSNDYSAYNITIGEERDCRVDKINCKGEVFLEPLHPYYREGLSYPFTVQSFEKRVDKVGATKEVVILSDSFNNEIVVPYEYFGNSIPSLDESVPLKIKQIVKGSIIISGSSQLLSTSKNEDGDVHDFSIVGESKGLDGKIYFIVENNNKRQYSIPRDYYLHYGLEINTSFKGRYLRYKEGMGINIEPLSPFFEPGKDYEFEVVEFVKLSDGMEDIMILKDEYGYPHQVSPEQDLKEGIKVRYRVIKMRKGWPLLEKV